MKLSDSKIIFSGTNTFEGNCRSNLIANIILIGLKLFISRKGGSLYVTSSPRFARLVGLSYALDESQLTEIGYC